LRPKENFSDSVQIALVFEDLRVIAWDVDTIDL